MDMPQMFKDKVLLILHLQSSYSFVCLLLCVLNRRGRCHSSCRPRNRPTCSTSTAATSPSTSRTEVSVRRQTMVTASATASWATTSVSDGFYVSEFKLLTSHALVFVFSQLPSVELESQHRAQPGSFRATHRRSLRADEAALRLMTSPVSTSDRFDVELHVCSGFFPVLLFLFL